MPWTDHIQARPINEQEAIHFKTEWLIVAAAAFGLATAALNLLTAMVNRKKKDPPPPSPPAVMVAPVQVVHVLQDKEKGPHHPRKGR